MMKQILFLLLISIVSSCTLVLDENLIDNNSEVRIHYKSSYKVRALEREILEFIKDTLSSRGFIKSYNAQSYKESSQHLKNTTSAPLIKQIFSSFFIIRHNNKEMYFASCEKNFLNTICTSQKVHGFGDLHSSKILDAVYNVKGKLKSLEKLDLVFDSYVTRVIEKIDKLVEELS